MDIKYFEGCKVVLQYQYSGILQYVDKESYSIIEHKRNPSCSDWKIIAETNYTI